MCVCVSGHAIGRGFAPRPGYTKDHPKMVQIASLFSTDVLG